MVRSSATVRCYFLIAFFHVWVCYDFFILIQPKGLMGCRIPCCGPVFFFKRSKWTFWFVSSTKNLPPWSTPVILWCPRQARISLRVPISGIIGQKPERHRPHRLLPFLIIYQTFCLCRNGASCVFLRTSSWIYSCLAKRRTTNSSLDLNPCAATSRYMNQSWLFSFLLEHLWWKSCRSVSSKIIVI